VGELKIVAVLLW